MNSRFFLSSRLAQRALTAHQKNRWPGAVAVHNARNPKPPTQSLINPHHKPLYLILARAALEAK